MPKKIDPKVKERCVQQMLDHVLEYASSTAQPVAVRSTGMRRSLRGAVALSILAGTACLLLPGTAAAGPADKTAPAGNPSPSSLGYKNIGSAAWNHNMPHIAAIAAAPTEYGMDYICPKGWYGPQQVSQTTRKVSDHRGGFLYKPVIRKGKYVTVRWGINGRRTVPEGTNLCSKSRVLVPSSPQELATWTYAKGKDILWPANVEQPPDSTCTPAVPPTAVTSRIASFEPFAQGSSWRLPEYVFDDYNETYDYTQVGPPSRSGIYTFEVTMVGGSGQLVIPRVTPQKKVTDRYPQGLNLFQPDGNYDYLSLKPDGSVTYKWSWAWSDDKDQFTGSDHNGKGGTGQWPAELPVWLDGPKLRPDCGFALVPTEMLGTDWERPTEGRDVIEFAVTGTAMPFAVVSMNRYTEDYAAYPPAP